VLHKLVAQTLKNPLHRKALLNKISRAVPDFTPTITQLNSTLLD
jgi:hypothetical protein